MSDNPLEHDRAREDKIRHRAYHLWETDGKPHGRDAEYWERASELVALEESAGAGQLPNPASVPGADPSRTEPVEEAFLQDNLGEFPDRLADQGEVRPTPSRRAKKGVIHESPAPGAEGPASTAKPSRTSKKADAAADAPIKPKRSPKPKG
ncbi:DUF2934 domain-containing protein [Acetobacteraceae bacterium KSS8]|uniref:DUF2934 domain-containing protein n=1 Tax=Endosaccharibacter trunci TaxID=2812733 RepID=A0ABT1W6B6_9PROT|nr:DUF2934 domain-containing protein [Acetobacteraceae bacterium KSS8]